MRRDRPQTHITLTCNQQYAIKNRETRAHPFGQRREFADKHLDWSMFTKRVNLKKLTLDEVRALRDAIEDYVSAISHSKRHGPTRRSLRRKLKVVDDYLERSVVDRLGDVVR